MNRDKETTLIEAPIDAELDEVQEQSIGYGPIKVESRRDERFIAFHLIYAADRFDYTVDLDEIFSDFVSGFDIMILSDSFAVQLARGAIEQRNEFDERVKPYLKNWKLERLGVCTRLILRMALWELEQTDAIPSVVINEAVEIAKAFAEKDAYKFINGILDELCKKEFKHKMKAKDDIS